MFLGQSRLVPKLLQDGAWKALKLPISSSGYQPLHRFPNRLQTATMATHTSTTNDFVPSIDISPFLKDPGSLLASRVVEDVRKACKTTGFFQITGHGLTEEIQGDLFKAAQRFFALPMKEKEKLDARTQVGRRGYDVLATQKYHDDHLPDLKEGFYVGHDLSLDDPMVKARRFFMGPNAWPSSSVLREEDFKKPVEKYYTAINDLALKILSLVAHTLPYGPDVFSKFSKGNVVAPLRLLHYPPMNEKENQHGAGAHSDFGAITLLLQDENEGLEVLNTATDEFVPIKPTPGALVINVGDMLADWVGGRYKSAVHRVINRRPTDRYSAVFFFDGDVDHVLDPLDGSEPLRKDWTVEKHMMQRITASYGKEG